MNPLRSLLLGLLLLAGGCASKGDVDSRLDTLELTLERLEGRVDRMAGLSDRVEGLEKSLVVEDDPDSTPGSLSELEARLAQLESRLDELETGTEPDDDDERPARVVRIPTPKQPGQPPAQGEPITILSVLSPGGLLLRTPKGVLRVELHGIDPPRRAERYRASPRLLRNHQKKFGRKLESDAPWRAAKAHLEDLLQTGRFALVYPGGKVLRSRKGAVRAYVVRLEGDRHLDLNAAMIRDGFALAGSGHEREEAYQRLEREARGEEHGLHTAR